jgi:hypothetical protein
MAKKAKAKSKTIIKKAKNGDTVIIKKKDYEVGKGKPPKHTQFKKGKVANPTGINCNPIKRAINEFNSMELSKAIKLVMTSTEEEALAAVNDPSTTLGFKTVLRAMIDASHDGNYSKFYEIAEHVIGKIPNKVDINGGISLGAKLDDKEKLKEVLRLVENEF